MCYVIWLRFGWSVGPHEMQQSLNIVTEPLMWRNNGVFKFELQCVQVKFKVNQSSGFKFTKKDVGL